jgi:glycosyltransferase involved in cell wall biosynthesis
MKISIITVTYNSEKTIKDTLESVLRQTFRDIEYIIVDGASKDRTLEIIKEYEPAFGDRLCYISEIDHGAYDAMNKGLGMATGDIVGFLNSDDFFTSDDVLLKIARTYEENEMDAVYGDIHYVKADNLSKKVRYYSSRFFSRPLMRCGFMPAHPSFYCKRNIYLKYGGFDTSYKIAADFENLLRLIYIHRIRTEYINKDFVTMRMGGISTAGMASRKQIMKDHLMAMKKNGVYSNFFFLSLRYLYKIFELIRG